MIIDYKNELLHQVTAIRMVVFAYHQFISNLHQRRKNYYAPLSAIMSCIAGSHKLDYIRFCCDSGSCYTTINQFYRKAFSHKEELRRAIASYQSASRRETMGGCKPYQLINAWMKGQMITPQQEVRAKQWVQGLKAAFRVASSRCTLQPGQRLYRGESITTEMLLNFQQAIENKSTITRQGFTSTSLSECIALSFAMLMDAGNVNVSGSEKHRPHIPVVFVLINRHRNLPFLMPDALRKPEHCQGQMEILLEHGLTIMPTHVDLNDQYAKVYADIL